MDMIDDAGLSPESYKNLTNEEISKIPGIANVIIMILDYYRMRTNEFEQKYYMRIPAPRKISKYTDVPSPIVGLEIQVRKYLKIKEIKQEIEKHKQLFQEEILEKRKLK